MAAQEKFDLVIRAHDEASGIIKRINDELASTTQSIAALNSAFAKSAGASAPMHNVAAAFRNAGKGATEAAEGFSKADLKMVALGSNLSGLPPAITQVIHAFAFGTPVIAAATLGVGLLTQAFLAGNVAAAGYSEAVRVTNEELAKLASGTDAFAKKSREERDLRLSVLQGQEQSIIQNLEQIKTTSEFDAVLSKTNVTLADSILARSKVAAANAGLRDREEELKKALVANREEQAKLSAALRKDLLSGIGALDSPMSLATERADELTAALDKMMASLRLASGNVFGGLGDTSNSGFATEADQLALERKRLDEAFAKSGTGPMSWIAEHDKALDGAMEKWRDFSSLALSSTDQLASGITDMFFGMRDSLADVFKSMAASWVRYFINEILKQTALRLGLQLFGVLFPGSGNLIGAAGDTTSQGFSLAAGKVSPAGTGLDIASSGAKRFAPSGGTGASVTVQINGDVIGDESFVNKRLIPAIEKAARLQLTRIQVA